MLVTSATCSESNIDPQTTTMLSDLPRHHEAFFRTVKQTHAEGYRPPAPCLGLLVLAQAASTVQKRSEQAVSQTLYSTKNESNQSSITQPLLSSSEEAYRKELMVNNNLYQSDKSANRVYPFKCLICNQSFQLNRCYISHIAKNRCNNGPARYVCNVCHRSCTSRWGLKEHQSTHNIRIPRQCSECDKFFISQKSLKNHCRTEHVKRDDKAAGSENPKQEQFENNHHKIVLFLCQKEGCDKEYTNRDEFIKHIEQHLVRCFPCLYCNKEFTFPSNTRRHMRDKHEHIFESQQSIFKDSKNKEHHEFQLSASWKDHNYAAMNLKL